MIKITSLRSERKLYTFEELELGDTVIISGVDPYIVVQADSDVKRLLRLGDYRACRSVDKANCNAAVRTDRCFEKVDLHIEVVKS